MERKKDKKEDKGLVSLFHMPLGSKLSRMYYIILLLRKRRRKNRAHPIYFIPLDCNQVSGGGVA